MYQKKSEAEISQIVKEIGRMFAAGMVDREIIDRLNLKRATFYWYRKRLFKESGNLFKQTSDDELLFHKDLLQERLTRMFRQIEIDLRNTTLSSKDRAGLYMAAQSYAINIFRLNYEGIVALRNAYGNRTRTPLAVGSTGGGSTEDTGSGPGVLRVLQAQGREGAAATEPEPEPSIPSPVVAIGVEPEQEPDESEIY
jgi:hypothetical protein